MEKSILNEISVKQLYDYPESGCMKMSLIFLVCSVAKKENHQLLLELADLKYKISNIFVDDEKQIKVGNYIIAKKFSYSFNKNVDIKITDFEVFENKASVFMKRFEEYKKEGYVDCYFMYRKKEKDFIGFNNEKLNLTNKKINSKIKFEDSKIYLFKRLQHTNTKEVQYNEKISFISENSGEIIFNDFSNLNSDIPYCFEGKIIEIDENKNKILLVPFKIDNIFISLKINKVDKDLEGKFIRISSAKYNSTYGNIINFTSTEFTKTEISQLLNVEEDHRIYIKLNFCRSKMNNKVSKVLIELPNKRFDELIVSEEFQYYMYNNNNQYYDLEYFIQNITLLYDDGFSRLFQFFVYEGFLNEANIDISIIGACAYEFLYYSLDQKFLPTFIDIKELGKYDNFQTFGNKTRKKITFINIPIQNEEDIGHGNSFLVIKLCKEKDIKLYGTFKLNSVEFKPLKNYAFNSTIDDFLKDIHQDFDNYFNNKTCTIDKLRQKYLGIKPQQLALIKEELLKNFKEYKIKEEKHTFDYFNALVIWNIFNYYTEMKSNISGMEKYFKIYKILVDRKLNYVDKSKILLDAFFRLKESKTTLVFPKLFFYDDLKKDNAYKIAYNFQFSFIEKLTEFSGLYQPFLLLDSYFMDMICYEDFNIEKKNVKNGVISAYSISMMPLNNIKKHLKKTIKPYFFIIKKGVTDERKYYASVQTWNNVITYNEKILLSETTFEKVRDSDELSIKKNYAFVLYLENMHENFSHNKENILNTKDSPTLYFNNKFEYVYTYDYHSDQIGEAGVLLESFICDISILEEMKKLKYEMGEYLNIDYFVDKDFGKLIDKFSEIKQKQEIDDEQNEDNEFKKELLGEYKQMNNEKNKLKEGLNNNEIIAENQGRKQKISAKSEKKQEIVVFSRYNVIIIKAETLKELSAKIKDMKTKVFVKANNAVPKSDGKTLY